jgi:hypothetical protein
LPHTQDLLVKSTAAHPTLKKHKSVCSYPAELGKH